MKSSDFSTYTYRGHYWLKARKNHKVYFNYRAAMFLVCPLILISCHSNQSSQKDSNKQLTQVKSYSVLTLSPQTAVIYSDFPATIQGQQNVEIRPKIDGYLENIYVDEGSIVKKGQLLFRISAPSYEQEVRTAEANIKIAQADLNSAAMEVNKVKPLVAQDIVSKYELESAQYTLQSKKAALAQAEANLVNAKINLAYSKIFSPANGVIGALPFKIGSLVNSTTTQPLTTVSNIQNVYVYFSINEKQQLDFFINARGNTLKEKLATYPPVSLLLPNGTVYYYKGRIETIGGLVNVSTGSISLRATFPNPDGIIRSGGSATVRIPMTFNNVLLIPQSATYQIQGQLFVYVLSPDNTVHSTSIEVNSNASGHSYVLQSGLKQGDKIVVDGIGNLREGLSIKPIIVRADSVYASL